MVLVDHISHACTFVYLPVLESLLDTQVTPAVVVLVRVLARYILVPLRSYLRYSYP